MYLGIQADFKGIPCVSSKALERRALPTETWKTSLSQTIPTNEECPRLLLEIVLFLKTCKISFQGEIAQVH